ncbi:CbiX/SirB N-terminal domain-containing protein [Paenibacillus sonchi]
MRKESAAGAARRLHQQLNGRLMPRELQISVAGCGMACSSAVLEDIGLVYSKGSYELYLGGKKTGRTPHAGSKVRTGMSEEEAVAAVTEVVEQYCAQGSQDERFYTFFERMGSGISANYPQAESALRCEHMHTHSHHNHDRAQGITAVLLVGHGSRVEEGNEELRNFTLALAARRPELAIETCFIELSAPSISEGIDKCVLGGAGTVYVVPIILFAAGHSKLDIPLALDQAKLKYPDVEFVYGRPIGVQERAVEILLDRIAGAVPQPVQVSAQPELSGELLEKTLLVERGSSGQQNTGGLEIAAALSVGETAPATARDKPYSKARDEDTIVLVMGRGGSDPDANSDLCKLARLLWERTPYKSVEACFIAITKPSLPAGLERCLALGARKIIVLPYLLFTGVLMRQFNETVNRFAAANPEIEVEAGTCLGSHPLLSDMLLERIEETLAGRTAANCDNCVYREEASAHHHHHHHHHGHHHHEHDHHDDHHDHHSHGEDGHESGRRSQPASADAEVPVPPQSGASYSADAVHPAGAPKARWPR